MAIYYKALKYKNIEDPTQLYMIVLRAGDNKALVCSPVADLGRLSFDNYKTVEMIITRELDLKTIVSSEGIGNGADHLMDDLNAIGENFESTTSDFDNSLIFANISKENFEDIIEIFETAYKLQEEEYYPSEGKVVSKAPKPKGSFCRGCNYFNSYFGADDVIADGKHTCWSCSQSWERRRKGLSEDREERIGQIAMIMKYNNIK